MQLLAAYVCVGGTDEFYSGGWFIINIARKVEAHRIMDCNTDK